MYVCIYIYRERERDNVYMCICVYIYIYIYSVAPRVWSKGAEGGASKRAVGAKRVEQHQV